MKNSPKKDFYKLKHHNILFFSKSELKKHIEKIWHNTDEWWNKKDNIKIRKILKEKYSEIDLTTFNFSKKKFD